MWETIIALFVVALIITGAIIKIVRDKKKGIKCIGCPSAQGCAKDEVTPCGSCSYKEIKEGNELEENKE